MFSREAQPSAMVSDFQPIGHTDGWPSDASAGAIADTPAVDVVSISRPSTHDANRTAGVSARKRLTHPTLFHLFKLDNKVQRRVRRNAGPALWIAQYSGDLELDHAPFADELQPFRPAFDDLA